MRSGRLRTVLGALSTIVLVGWASTGPRASDAAVGSDPIADELLAAAAPTSAEGEVAIAGDPASDPAQAEAESAQVLAGLAGAATALTIGDAELALRLLEAEPEPAVGTDDWFAHSALRGRAHRLLGQHAEAVAQLEALAARRDLPKYFPKDVLGLELGRARLAHGEALGGKAGDAVLEEAASDLARLKKLEPNRSFAIARVLRGRALAAVKGTSTSATKAAATRAAKALDELLKDYPHHPMVGELWLERARATERAGKIKDAAAAYRSIAIHRAGEPEAEAAWAELERLAGEHKSVSARPFSIGENLQRAAAARGLRWVELSREILDGIIDDPKTPAHLKKQAIDSRAWTAYKQRDFQRCADDLRPEFERTGNVDVRDRLMRCLERGELWDEAIERELDRAKTKRKSAKAAAIWSASELAFRAGDYERTEKLLEQYGKLSKGHRGERAWLAAWIAYRQGREKEAIGLFREAEKKSRGDSTRARYFRGKLMVRSADPAVQKDGKVVLQQLAAGSPWSYYGLVARQRLKDAGLPEGTSPKLTAVADEADPLDRREATTLLAELDAEMGAAWPPIRRAYQLYRAGFTEEARRELRVATFAYLKGREGFDSHTRSEATTEGLAWKAEWKIPKIAPTKAGRKTLRDRETAERLRTGLRDLSLAMDEPWGWSKLSEASDGTFKARWHPRAFRAAVEREARVQGIDPIHLWSLMYTESRFRRHVVSPVGARGALQIMPWTGRQLAERLGEMEDGRFDADTLFDIDTNAHLASYYVAELLRKFQGQGPMAYASYNGGPSNVARWLRSASKGKGELEMDAFIEEMVFTESYRYAKRVVEVHAAYSMLYRGELPELSNAVNTKIEDNIDF
jgi:soluble lytic murein transglycosylase-like protein